MVDLIHKDLPDAKNHYAKGSIAATADTFLGALGDGTSTFQALPSPARYITVSASGADWTTLADAITAAIALTPTASDPVVIQVFPGTYTTLPLTIPSFVSVVGANGPHSTIIKALTTTATLITMGDDSHMHSVILDGANGAGGVGFTITLGQEAHIQSVVITDCTTASIVAGSGTCLLGSDLEILRTAGKVLTTGVLCTGGSITHVANCRIGGISGTPITTGVSATTGAVVKLVGLDVEYCTTGASTISTSKIEVLASWFSDCTTAVSIGASGIGHLLGVDIEDSTLWDVIVVDATGQLQLTGTIATHEKMSIHPDSVSVLAYLSETPGDEALKVGAELHVGSETNPKESALGGGDSHVRGMLAFTNTNGEIGTWDDITSDVNVDDGTSAVLFPGVTANNAIYVGGDQQFPGLKSDVTAAMVVGAGTVLTQYWDGSAWTGFNTMSAEATAPYAQYANEHLTRIMEDQIRFDFPSLAVDWATKALDGETKYWARYLITSDIATSPQVDIFKLHTHRFEVNADGLTEAYGNGEKTRDIPLGTFTVSTLEDPGDQVITYATGISANVIDNSFTNNNVKGRVYAIEIPAGLDTSRALTLKVPWAPSSGGTGDVEMEVEYAVANEGDVLDGAIVSTNVPVVESVAGQAEELFVSEFSISIPTALPGGILALKIFRDATGGNAEDTLAENIQLVTDPVLTGTFWR